MGRIDIKGSEDKTLERRHVDLMLRYKNEYELVKNKRHKLFKNASEFYKERQICKQNFLKYYRRYQNSGGNSEQLLPQIRGRKVKEMLTCDEEIVNKIKDLRGVAYNRYDISDTLKSENNIDITPSKIYRLLVKLGLNRLNSRAKEENQ
jgi:hypothetical protein